MPDSFDPYLKWLGIAPEEQPPNHYRLLGVPLFIDDPDVIESAADRQMKHVRSFQSGRHAQLSQQLLNELAMAKVCLLDRDHKVAYDSELREKLANRPSRAARKPAPLARSAAPIVTAEPLVDVQRAEGSHVIRSRSPKLDGRSTTPVAILLIVIVVLASIAAVAWYSTRDGGPVARDEAFRPIIAEPPKPATSPRPSEQIEPPVKPANPEPAEVGEPVVPTVEVNPANGSAAEVSHPPDVPDVTPPAEVEDTVDPAIKPTVEPKAEPEVQNSRLAVPDAEPLRQAGELVQEVYGQRIAEAETPEDRAKLAEQMLGDVNGSGDTPAAQFVMWREARDLAIGAGRPDLAMRAMAGAAERFELDLLALKLDALKRSEDAARSPAEYHRVAEVALSEIDAGLTQARFDWSADVAELAAKAARKARDGELVKATRQRSDQLAASLAAWKEDQQAIATLAQQPDDPDANLAHGRFVCFVLGDWRQGLPLLARGSDTVLKSVAQQELDEPAAANDRVQLADAWFDASSKQKGIAADACKAWAAHWYNSALLDATGLTKIRAQRQLKLLGPIGAALPAAPNYLPSRNTTNFDNIRPDLLGIMEVHGNLFCMFPDSRHFASWCQDWQFVIVDDLDQRREMYRLTGHEGQVRWCDVTPDSHTLVTVSEDQTMRVWDLAAAKEIRKFNLPAGRHECVRVLPDGRRALYVAEQTVRLIDLTTGQEIYATPALSRLVEQIAVTPDGTLAVFSGCDRELYVWDVRRNKQVARMPEFDSNIYLMDISPDGRYLVARHLGEDRPLRIYDVKAGTIKHEIAPVPGGRYYNLFDLSPDGRYVITAGEDRILRQWDLETGRQVRTLASHGGNLRVAITPDGRRMISDAPDIGTWMYVSEMVDASTPPRQYVLDRKVAELVLRCGRDVNIVHAGRAYGINPKQGLPDTPFIARHVNFNDSNITDDTLKLLTNLTGLEFINLWNTPITDKGVAALKDIRGIYRLHLGKTKITNASLAMISGMTAMEWLGLNEVPGITGQGLVHLEGMRRLRELYLSKSPIDDAGLVHVGQIESLESLHLEGTPITDAGLAQLTSLSKLKFLDIRSTRITDKAVQQFKALLPECRIER